MGAQILNNAQAEVEGLINTQVAISQISIDPAVEILDFIADGIVRREIISVLIQGLEHPRPVPHAVTSSGVDGESVSFLWDVVHSFAEQSLQNVTILLSSTLR